MTVAGAGFALETVNTGGAGCLVGVECKTREGLLQKDAHANASL